MNREVWKPCPGYEGLYEVSNLGRVRSLDRIDERGRTWPGKVLKPAPGRGGYLRVGLYRNGRLHRRCVHRLVCRAFHGRPRRFRTLAGKIRVQRALHWDGDVTNNRAGNLRWGSDRENVADAIRHGTWPIGERNGRAKLSAEQVRGIRRDGRSRSAIARDYGVSDVAIGNIQRGKHWRHLQPDNDASAPAEAA